MADGFHLGLAAQVAHQGKHHGDVPLGDRDIVNAGPVADANPAINQRNLDTQVAVQSGQTVLLGGMIQDQDGDSRNGVPVLSKIPVLGSLFGSTTKTRQRTELIVLITPRVITNSDEAQQMTQEYEQKFESLAPLRARNAVPDAGQAPQPAHAAPLNPEPAASKENPRDEK